MTAPPREIVVRWVDAFNRADIEALTALYDVNAVSHQLPEHPLVGRSAIVRMFEGFFARRGPTCIPVNLFSEGEWALLEWRDPHGLHGASVFQVRDGAILLQRGYWDRSGRAS